MAPEEGQPAAASAPARPPGPPQQETAPPASSAARPEAPGAGTLPGPSPSDSVGRAPAAAAAQQQPRRSSPRPADVPLLALPRPPTGAVRERARLFSTDPDAEPPPSGPPSYASSAGGAGGGSASAPNSTGAGGLPPRRRPSFKGSADPPPPPRTEIVAPGPPEHWKESFRERVELFRSRRTVSGDLGDPASGLPPLEVRDWGRGGGWLRPRAAGRADLAPPDSQA